MDLDPTFSLGSGGMTLMALLGLGDLLLIVATLAARLATPASMALRGVAFLAVVVSMTGTTQLQVTTAIVSFFALMTLAYFEDSHE